MVTLLVFGVWGCIFLYFVKLDFKGKAYLAIAVTISLILPALAKGELGTMLSGVGHVIRAVAASLYLIGLSMPAVSR